MVTWNWPHLDSAPEAFYRASLAPTNALWSAWRMPTAVGSGRPSGPRNWQWSATVVLAVAALEAGLEELLLAGHARRAGLEGTTIPRKEREHLVENPLQAPNSGKIERLMFASFGRRMTDLAPWPSACSFTARRKTLAHAGSGRGSASTSPANWEDLAKWVDAVVYIRHAIAHGDAAKHASFPQAGEGFLWVKMKSGGWSVQQPHALTTLRTVVGCYNAVALVLHTEFGSPGPSSLQSPDSTFDYGS